VTRWNDWLKRARACYRASASIDAAKAAIDAAQLDVRAELGPDGGPLEEVRAELAAAEGALLEARRRLKAALDERALRPDNREADFWPGARR
jgi:hypothetical protein